MAFEYTAPRQLVELNQNIIFNDSFPCNSGDVYHENGTGVFLLKGRRNGCNCCCAKQAQYEVKFVGNIAIPTGGTVGPIAVALSVDGNVIQGTRAIVTPAAVEDFFNVSIDKLVSIPNMCGCETISIVAVSGLVDDPTGTPAPVIDLINGNLEITPER